MVSGPHATSLYVTVIAENRETIDGLNAYFDGAGVASHTTRALSDASMIPPTTTAVVLFPDEFDRTEVVSRISSLRAALPGLLVVVVSSAPQSFRPAFDPDGLSLLPVVLPKPAFGWMILDAIREHARSESP